MITVGIKSIGISGPGMQGWEQTAQVLRQPEQWLSSEVPRYKPTLLPANERRRATTLARIAFQVGEEAITHYAGDTSQLGTVFASSGGDMEVVHKICESLASNPGAVSPTLFHNSVHNAPAGYWSIASKAQGPSSSIAAYNYSFASGLLDAALLCADNQSDVLLVVYDIPPMEPLYSKRPIPFAFAVALILTPEAVNSLGQLTLSQARCSISQMSAPQLETLRSQNPAARALPLLENIAQQKHASLGFELPGGAILNATLECDLSAVADAQAIKL